MNINKIIIIISIPLLGIFIHAQTNVFPDSGNVGIGIGMPQSMLHVHSQLSQQANAQVNWAKFGASTANYDVLDIFSRRMATGASWESSALFIQRKVDVSPMGFLKFGGWNISFGVGSTEYLFITNSGAVGIGAASPTHTLTVNGPIRAKEIIVDTGWADDVFSPDYNLASLEEVQTHIEQEGRLPGMPSAKEVAEKGISLGEAQSLLLRKIEELTLHVIHLKKENEQLEQRLTKIETSK